MRRNFGCGHPRTIRNTTGRCATRPHGGCRECKNARERTAYAESREAPTPTAPTDAPAPHVVYDGMTPMQIFHLEKARRAERQAVPDEAKIAYQRCLEAKPALSLGRPRKLNVKASEDLADYLPVFVGDSRR